jgi:hypothetical protein
MSILDVTEDQIFQTLGKGKDPNFKPIEKARPAMVKPKKTNSKTSPLVAVQPVEVPVQQVVITPPDIQNDETVKKLTQDINELNARVYGLQKMVEWYMVPQFVVILVLLLVIVVKANS